MLTVENLTKTYRGVRAVDDLSFDVPDGQVTGFLGPNGAGKSTTMRMCVGLENPTGGSAHFDGVGFRDLKHPAATVGTLLDANWFHPGRSARAHLGFMAGLQQLPMTRVDETLERVGLADVAGKKVGGYSLGMKQRLGLACALLGNPQHLLLDEPVNGLDPEGVHWMRDRIREFAAEGRCVLVSSHLLSEMQLTADHLVVIGKGRLVGQGTLQEFVDSAGAASWRISVDRPEVLLNNLQALGHDAVLEGEEVVAPDMPAAELGALCRDNHLLVTGMHRHTKSLEEAFLGATAEHVAYRAI